ncbi:hypothetical protein JW865_07725 [Candidatus Bathyarchaeota archaeon]|nr:hypothetical protein [Candidatus Bathyarchaeota archaeon]
MMECSVKGRNGKHRKLFAFKEFRLKNGTIIGVFQGSYGNHPDLDIIVKYQELRKRVRTPQHIHWAIDLLLKKEHSPKLTKSCIKYLSDMWENIKPFTTKEEQQKCELKLTKDKDFKRFKKLDKYGEYSVEFIGHVIELMMIEEKTSNHEAYMFKEVLDALYNDDEIFTIVQKATYRGS